MDSKSKIIEMGRCMYHKLYNQVIGIIFKHPFFYVISHERSGTHFLINTLLRNVYLKKGWYTIGEWFGPYNNFTTRFAHINATNADWKKIQKSTTIIKSHCDRDLFEERYKKAKIIYIVRDPRDTLVSYFYYLNDSRFYQHNPHVADHRCKCFHEFIRRPISPFLKYNFSLHGDFSNIAERWASHVRGWLKAPDILVIRYEELHRNYKAVLEKAARFIGTKIKILPSPVKLNAAMATLPRKGIIGDWKNVFSKDDEIFLKTAVANAGIRWNEVIDHR